MKSRTTLSWPVLFGCALILALAIVNARAQQPAPSPSPQPQPTSQPAAAASDDETMIGGYAVTSSIEVGVRGLSVVGNGNKFRSDLNYHSGVRLFDSSFLLKRKEGRGTLFDELLVNTSGWGADPQGYTRVNVEKTGLYRFDANVRRFKYFNNLVNLALNQHTQNTRMQFGDYDLTLLPDNPRLKFYLGYSRDTQRGPGITTYDFSRDEFAINSNQQSSAHNWREGVDAKLGPVDISFLLGARYFKDESSFTTSFNRGNNPTNTSRIDTLRREMPTTGRHFFTRFSAHTLIAKKLDITGRFIYTKSRTSFDFFEQVTGRSGIAPGNIIRVEEFRTSGEVKRPYRVGDLGITFLATDKLRFSDTLRVDSFRIGGGDVLADFLLQSTPAGVPLPATTTNTFFLRTTEYRRVINTIEGDYQFSTRFAAHLGYRFTDRRIRLFQFNQNTTPRSTDETVNNRTNAVIFGFKARPVPGWNIYFDGEHGSADSVFTRVENNQYTNFRVRSRYAPNDTLSFNVSFVTRNNDNPSEVLQSSTLLPAGTAPNALDVAVRSRNLSASVDWTPTPKLSLSTGFTHLHLTSNAGIILFITNQSRLGQSRYFMRDNFFYLNAFVNPFPRVSLFASYRISKDNGQGSRVSTDPTIIIGSYPMAFQSPEARLIIKLNRRIDWNIGYQYYNYRDRFFPVQNYHAHLPFTSLRIYFGGRESQ